MTASGPGGGGFVRGPQDVVAGVVVIALSAIVLSALSRITTASYAAISPALFPQLCTYGLLVGGVVLIARGLLRDGPGLGRLPLRPVVLVTASVVAFGAVAPIFGYAPAGLLTVLIGGAATPDARLREIVAFALGLIAFSIGLFSYVLKLSIPVVAMLGYRL